VSVIGKKVWFDLWHSKARTVLVVSSVATGVFAVGAIFGMNDQMLPAMDAAHQASLPPHMTMFLDEAIEREAVLALAQVPGVVSVQPDNTVALRYKLHPEDDWSQGSLLMRDDYEHQAMDLIQLRGGEWPEGERLGIERMHAPFYGLGLGDEVIVDVGGREHVFTINGIIRHPFVPPPSMYDLAWFFGDADAMERFGIPPGRFTRFQVRIEPYSEEFARQTATAIKDRLAKQGVGVLGTMYQDPNKHWGRPFIEGFSMVSQILAVVSLLLSGVLVLNTLTAVITQQTTQIGVLKAIGAGRGDILRAYLSFVLVYGLLSLGIALPLGMAAAYAATRSFLSLFNIDYEAFALSSRAAGLQVLAALIVPLAAALWPILHGAAITVRQAVAAYGLGGDFGSGWLDQAVERVALRFLAPRYAMVLANTLRRKGRLVLTQLVLVIASVMFLVVMSLNSSLGATIDSEFGRRTHDVIVQFEDPQRIDAAAQLARTVPGVVKADSWITVPVTVLHEGQNTREAGLGSELQGVPLDDPMYEPQIVSGRWLAPGDSQMVVLNRDMAEDENIAVGDVVTLDLGFWGRHEWQVVGLYQTFVMFGGGFELNAIYAPRPSVLAVMHRGPKTSIMLVRTANRSAADTEAVANALQDMFDRRNMKVYAAQTVASLRQTTQASFGIVVNMMLVMAVIMGLVGGIGLMGSLSISVVERTKEIGVLRALGARSWAILSMFMLEGMTQGALAWLLSLPLALSLAPLLSALLGRTMFNSRLTYLFNSPAVLAWLGIILCIAALASILPARSATRISVRQSLAYE
jgi:putative ABC transport system permease protein